MRTLTPPDRYDLAGTLGRIALIKGGEPTLKISAAQVWWATRTPDGPGTFRAARSSGDLVVPAYGPGAGWLLDRAPAIPGLDDDLSDFPAGRHPLVDRLWR